jgi:hypothetical protein
MIDTNKTVIRPLIDEFWTKQNFGITEDLCAPEMIYHNDGASLSRPDMLVSVDDLVAEGEKVARRWTARGTHRCELRGIPPTNRKSPSSLFPENRGSAIEQSMRLR